MLSKHQTTHSQQDYLEAVLVLEKENGDARVNDIAKSVGVGKSSASIAIRNLRELGFVEHGHYGAVVLTKTGREVATEIHHRHMVLHRFLVDQLGLPEDIAEQDACQMEHVVSARFMKRLIKFLEFASECPLGGVFWDEERDTYVCYIRENSTEDET
ncbi:MAG: metal-dependent transcriptional regulator [Planctomycetota bacterium]|nr:metal-dependent transcriptional regulator [Planctomycetota bacterium]